MSVRHSPYPAFTSSFTFARAESPSSSISFGLALNTAVSTSSSMDRVFLSTLSCSPLWFIELEITVSVLSLATSCTELHCSDTGVKDLTMQRLIPHQGPVTRTEEKRKGRQKRKERGKTKHDTSMGNLREAADPSAQTCPTLSMPPKPQSDGRNHTSQMPSTVPKRDQSSASMQ